MNNRASTQSLSLRTKTAKLQYLIPVEHAGDEQLPAISGPINTPSAVSSLSGMPTPGPSLPSTPVSKSMICSPRLSSPTALSPSNVNGHSRFSSPGLSKPLARNSDASLASSLRRFSSLSVDFSKAKLRRSNPESSMLSHSRDHSRKTRLGYFQSSPAFASSENGANAVEQNSLEVLDLELKSLRHECKRVKSCNTKARYALQRMVGVVRRIKELASCQPIDVAVKLRDQADDLEAILNSALEDLHSGSSNNSSQEFLQSVASPASPESPKHRSLYGGGIPLSESGHESVTAVPVGHTAPEQSGKEQPLLESNISEEVLIDPRSPLLPPMDQRNRESVAEASTSATETTQLPELTVLGDASEEQRRGVEINEVKEENKTEHDEDEQGREDEDEGVFQYVEGPAEQTAAAQRPLSRAQANRHSAIIGDSLFSLLAFDIDGDTDPITVVEDEDSLQFEGRSGFEHATKGSNNNSSGNVGLRSTIGDNIDHTGGQASDGTAEIEAPNYFSQQPSMSQNYATAITTSLGRDLLWEQPSVNSPTMTCKVDLDGHGGGRYVRRKFAASKVIVGRSSLAAYQGRDPT